MTSALSMQIRGRTADRASDQQRRLWMLFAPLGFVMMLTGCFMPRLHEPAFLIAPYERPQVWGVAPFINESGVSHADPVRFADFFAQQAQDVQGINVIPVNRVIVAMRELDILRITGPDDARQLMAFLDLDGLIVGTITAYDPYRPMTLGAAVELHLAFRVSRPPPRALREIDTYRLVRSPTEYLADGEFHPVPDLNPIAQAAGLFDATNHRTLAWLNAYSKGRSVPEGAYGRDIYLVSMDMYMQFVCFRLLHDLLLAERLRINPIEEPSPRARAAAGAVESSRR